MIQTKEGGAPVAHEQPSASAVSVGPAVVGASPLLSSPLDGAPLDMDPELSELMPVEVTAAVVCSLVPSVSQGSTTNDPSGTQPVVVPPLLPGRIVSKLLG